MSENSACESTTEEQQLASLPSPPRQSLPTRQPTHERLPKARGQLVKAVSAKDKKQEEQPLARTLHSSGEAPEPSPEEESALEELSIRTLRSSKKAPEKSKEEKSPEEPSIRTLRTRRSSTKVPTPTTEEEAILEEKSVSEYEPVLDIESISGDDEPAPSSLTPLTMKQDRAPKDLYKALESGTQEYDGDSNQCSSDFSGGHLRTKRLRDESDEEEPHEEKRGGTHQTRSPTYERDPNRELRELSAMGSVEVLPTRLRSESRDTRTPPTNLLASKSSRLSSPMLSASPVTRACSSKRVSGSEATPPKRLILEAVAIPVWNRKTKEKRHLEPEIKEEGEEEEDDGGNEKPLELVDGPPPMPLNALAWHPSLSTFKNFRPVSMSPSLYTRSQNVVEQLMRQTSDGRMGEEMEQEEDENQNDGMEAVVVEVKVKGRNSGECTV